MKKFKKMMASMLFASICFAQITSGVEVKAELKEISEDTTYIVTAKNSRAYEQLAEEYELQMENTTTEELSEEGIMVLSVDEHEIQQLEQDARIESIEEDILVHGCGENGIGENGIEWNLDAVNVGDEIKAGNTENKSGIKVALLDSGIDYSEDIDVKERKNFVPGQDEVSVLYEDSTGHGTCIAGIMAAKDNELGITGINPNIELYSAKVLDRNNSSKISRIIDAINWAIEKDVDILSLSFGTTTNSEVLHDAIKKAYENNILIVAAAGNGTQVEYPAAYPETIAVGAIGTDGIASEDSATGEELELVAPGEQILSTGAFDGLMTCGGTSMAVPHVVGVASLLWEKDITADADLIRMVLDAGAKTYDDKEAYGYGLVDYEYASSIYDECKNVYENNKCVLSDVEELQQDGTLKENISSIEAEVYEDVDYVEGLWTKAQHQTLPEQANGTLGTQGKAKLSSADLSILKLGAVANDSYVARMTPQPQWHGFWKNPYKAVKSNYVACYLYISKTAQQYKSGNMSQVPKLSGMTQTDYNAMKEIVNPTGIRNVIGDDNGNLTNAGIIPWQSVLGNANLVTNKNKGLFLYGMALHCATDTFSHSTNRLDGTSIQHDDYQGGSKTNDAHNQNYIKNRYICAAKIAAKVISNCISSLEGKASDFYIDAYDNSFYLTNISENIKAVDSTYYYNNKTYFDRLNLNRNV